MTRQEELREARLLAGLSMAEAARLTGTPYRTWQGWETPEGKNSRPAPAIAFAWLEMYGRETMKTGLNGASVVKDYLRRDIAPDRVEEVSQGLLVMWLFCNSYVCELRMGSKSLEREPGEWAVAGGPYINTYIPQEIANDLAARLESP